MTLAVIGGGPRALWVLERIAWWSEHSGRPAPETVVWTPRGRVGASEHYDPGLPAYLRLNVSGAVLDVWQTTGRGPSFDAWRERREPGSSRDPYPARALAGAYLDEQAARVLSRLPVSVREERVRRVTPGGSRRWQVAGKDGVVDVDDVVLVTGHARTWEGSTPSSVPAGAVGDELRIPDGARVIVRGAALTALDAVLTMTEGRGGVFDQDGASGLRYLPSGREPRITLVSRTGLLMLPKTEQAVLDGLGLGPTGAASAAAAARAGRDWPSTVLDAAGRLLAAGADHDTLKRAASLGPSAWEADAGDPAEVLRRDLRVSAGEVPGDARWALGQAWRMLYPLLVAEQDQRVSSDPAAALPPVGWADFPDWARALERLAFGPPPVNARKLLALLDAGLVDVAAGEVDDLAERACADAVVDAVLPPPGARDTGDEPWTALLAAGLVSLPEGGRGIRVTRDGACLDASGAPTQGLWALGRIAEDSVVGHDTLVRSLHPGPDRLAARLLGLGHDDVPLRAHLVGSPPLPGRLTDHQAATLTDSATLVDLLRTHGSPVNLIDPQPLTGHAEELVAAAAGLGVELRVFFARKANKALRLVQAALAAGHGVDVSSERELEQVLRLGADPSRLILTAAVKPDSLLQLAASRGVTISIDNHDELASLRRVAAGRPVPLALRLSAPEGLAPSRFGLTEAQAADLVADGALATSGRLVGIHFHLHGYATSDRAVALDAALDLVELARKHGHDPSFVDIGGGVPMRYLDTAEPWHEFLRAHTAALRGGGPSVTWQDHPLGRATTAYDVSGPPAVYPMWQTPVRGPWVRELLSTSSRAGGTLAERISTLGIRLHAEPGRALLDGCGLTVARVAFRKRSRDGEWLIGLEMNRTQCRSAAADFLLDPVLVPVGTERSEPGEGFLVGAYCVEAELLTWRRLRFPSGVAVGDLVAFVNTAGYQMHILESASHQIPLARNLVHEHDRWALDPVDAASDA